MKKITFWDGCNDVKFRSSLIKRPKKCLKGDPSG